MIEFEFNGIFFRFYDHIYAVSKCGKVMRGSKPHKPIQRPDGYMSVGRQRLLHRMVASCWCEKPKNSNLVHHKNHVKTDNHADNLEWITPKQHIGERHHGANGKYIRTEKTKQKLRSYRTGRKTSEETKQKQRDASIKLGCKPPNFLGLKHSDETKEKMSFSHARNKPCEINGVIYRSFSEAGKTLGERPLSLRRRCLSKNFPNYKML